MYQNLPFIELSGLAMYGGGDSSGATGATGAIELVVSSFVVDEFAGWLSVDGVSF